MKRFLLDNWRAKLMSLVVGFAIWYLIKKNIDTTETRWPTEHHRAAVK